MIYRLIDDVLFHVGSVLISASILTCQVRMWARRRSEQATAAPNN